MLAAAVLHALDHHVERLADDHARARTLAAGVSALGAFECDVKRVQTNILFIE